MLRVLREPIPENAPIKVQIAAKTLRMEAAKAAAPYVHPKLATTELNVRGSLTLEGLLDKLA
jgi:hypothetical protein